MPGYACANILEGKNVIQKCKLVEEE